MKSQTERLAENEAAFREANERINRTVARLGIDQPVPMICECGRSDCMKVIRVLPSDYERVRAFPNRFLYAPGHEERMPGSHRIGTLGEAIVIEKVGQAGRLAEATDPRG
jgi:hypothetical protein